MIQINSLIRYRLSFVHIFFKTRNLLGNVNVVLKRVHLINTLDTLER